MLHRSHPHSSKRARLLTLPLLLAVLLASASNGQAQSMLRPGQQAKCQHTQRAALCEAAVLSSVLPASPSPAKRTSERLLSRTSGRTHAQAHRMQRSHDRYVSRLAQSRSYWTSADKYGAPSARVDLRDSLALVALYDALDGPNWTDQSGWLRSAVAAWTGVTVDAT